MKYCTFVAVDFTNANFLDTNFEGVVFEDVKLCGANLSECINLTIDQIKMVCIDEATILPAYLLPFRDELIEASHHR